MSSATAFALLDRRRVRLGRILVAAAIGQDPLRRFIRRELLAAAPIDPTQHASPAAPAASSGNDLVMLGDQLVVPGNDLIVL